jgi:aminopeptidase N
LNRYLAGALVFVCALLIAPGLAAARAPSPGAAGSGDPFFPLAGNGGYDVGHYGLTLSYTPASHQLSGRAAITATATQDLSRFDLDLRRFTVSSVTVDGQTATFTRSGQELIITPATALTSGAQFQVDVKYAGKPGIVTDPDGSIEGFVPTGDGAFVVGEPQGSPSWYPVNDSPHDKATFDFAVTVPRGLKVLANGVLVSRTTAGGKTTWRWSETDPMAPYLATATLGRFDLSQYKIDGLPTYVAVDSKLGHRQVLKKLPAMVRFYTSLYGPYPFNAAGAIVDNAPRVGYALETQTKPVFDSMPDETTLAHETSHMWFGDSVTLTQWPDIWLHEGFATWSEWAWSGHNHGRSAATFFRRLYATPASDTAFWNPPAGDPGVATNLFDGTIYDRGGMTLQALREKIGNATFLNVLRTWAQDHRHGNATTKQFIDLAQDKSGMDLTAFFQAWLFTPGKPTSW